MVFVVDELCCPCRAGSTIDSADGDDDNKSYIPAPPVSVVLDQKVVQTDSVSNEGEKKKNAYLERDLFALWCSAADDGIRLYGAKVKVHLDTPYSGK